MSASRLCVYRGLFSRLRVVCSPSASPNPAEHVRKLTRPLVRLYSAGEEGESAAGPSHFSSTGPQQEQGEELSDKGQALDHPYAGISSSTFSDEINEILLGPLNPQDVEIKPDGLIYLPEIKYRRILNKAFGPGGWALMPRGEIKHFKNDVEGAQLITREYALYCHGRFVSQSLGEHTFYTKMNLSYGKAVESSKSNGLMRCCKDLGIASELWDPAFIQEWKANYAAEVWCENVRNKEKKKLWRKKDSKDLFPYPWKSINQA